MESELKIYKLPDLGLRDLNTIEEAAKRILKECSHHLQVNFARFKVDQNEKNLMQIRVGMRRTRVAFRIFKDIIPTKTRKKFKSELKYFGKRFGAARDLDELLYGMLGETCPSSKLEHSYKELRAFAQKAKAHEYSNLCNELAEGHFADFLASFEEWQSSDWMLDTDLSQQKKMSEALVPFALDIIEKGQRDLIKKVGKISEKSADDLHKVRKYVKRCRYNLRFFSSLFDQSRMEEGFKILVPLQNSLGHINDAGIGLILMSKFCEEVSAKNLSDCLSLISLQCQQASADTRIHLATVTKLLADYERFSVNDNDLSR